MDSSESTYVKLVLHKEWQNCHELQIYSNPQERKSNHSQYGARVANLVASCRWHHLNL